MTERFTTGDLWIQDNKNGITYFLDEQGGINALCNIINGMNIKMNRLEKENNELKNIIMETLGVSDIEIEEELRRSGIK